jgi:hypothetical protein
MDSYAQLCDSDGYSPFAPGNDYSLVMGNWTLPLAGHNNTNTVSPATIMASVLSTADSAPHAYLMLVSEANDYDDIGSFVVVHRPAAFPAPFGQPKDPKVHDINYAFVGDVVVGQIPQSVIFPADAFDVLPHLCRVPTVEGADLLIDGDEAAELFGPFLDDDAATQVVRIRRFQYLPPKYVSMFLNGPPLTPKEGWARLGGAIRNDGKEGELKPIMDALLLALTRGAVGRPSKWAQPHPVLARYTVNLLKHRRKKVEVDLFLFGGVPAAKGAQQIADRLGQLTSQMRAGQKMTVAHREADKAEKMTTVEKRLLLLLLLLAGVYGTALIISLTYFAAMEWKDWSSKEWCMRWPL